jgi:hypothetical protein
MDATEIKSRLNTILQHLPAAYSPASARKLMASFENYKHIAQSLPTNAAIVKSGVRATFDRIESDIKFAIIGTPKKESESRFLDAREGMTKGINGLLTVPEMDLERDNG